MDKHDETQMIEILEAAGVPDDLPELVLNGEAAPSARALERIKARTLERVVAGARRSPFPGSLLRRLSVAAVLILLLAASTVAWIGPARVWAGLQRVFSLVPGFGLLDAGDDSHISLMATEKIRIYYDEGYVEVAGVLAQQQATYIRLYFYDLPGYCYSPEDKFQDEDSDRHTRHMAGLIKQIHFYDQRGQRYNMKEDASYTAFSGGRETSVSLSLPPLEEETGLITLTVPLSGAETISTTIPLYPVDDGDHWSEDGNSVTRKGVTVTAAIQFYDETWVSLLVTPNQKSARVDELGRYYLDLPCARYVTLTGTQGREYSRLSRGRGTPPDNYFELFFEKIPENETELTLEIPVILFKEEGRSPVTLPVPAPGDGKIELNRKVDLGRFQVVLTGIELFTDYGKKYLRVHVDSGSPGEETLERFALEYQKTFLWQSSPISYSYEVDEETGKMKYFNLPLEGDPSRVKLVLKDPVYSVEGPWSFTFPVD